MYLAEEFATGDIYIVNTDNKEDAYKAVGIEFGMEDAWNSRFDTGNVDIDLFEIPKLKKNTAKLLIKHKR